MQSNFVETVAQEKIYELIEATNETAQIKYCPVSHTKGLVVKKVTLRGHVYEKYWDIVSDKNFYFCLKPECPIIYFNNIDQYFFTQQSVKSRVSNKQGPEPRPICYCLNVLEHHILDEIMVKNCCNSLDDIKKYTGAKTGTMCHITNPSGRCCGPIVNEIIAKGLKFANSDEDFQQEMLLAVHSGCEYCMHSNEDNEDNKDNAVEISLNNIVDACESCHIDWKKPNTAKDNVT